MKNILKKLISATLLLGLFLPSAAQALAVPPVAQGQSTTPTANTSIFRPPTQPQRAQNARDLSEVRQDDSRQCLAESGAGSGGIPPGAGVGSIIVPPLADALKEATQIEVIPNTVESVLNQAQPAIERELQLAMRESVANTLKTEFPRTLAQKIRDLRATGFNGEFSDPSNRGLFRGLVNDSIRESLPSAFSENLIGNTLSTAIGRGLRNTVQDSLTVNFRDIARPIVEEHYRVQIEGMIGSIPGLVQQQVEDMRDTIEGSISATEGIISGIRTCALNITCLITRGLQVLAGLGSGQRLDEAIENLPEVRQMRQILANLAEQLQTTKDFIFWVAQITQNKDQIIEEMIDGFAIELERSVTDPRNIARLGDQIADAIADPLNRQMEQGLDEIFNSITGPIQAMEFAISTADEALINPIVDAVDFQISAAVGAINQTTGTVIDHISGSIATTIDRNFGSILFPTAVSITGGAGAAGNWIAGGINQVGFGIQDVFAPRPRMDVIPNEVYDQMIIQRDDPSFVGPPDIAQYDNPIRESDFAVIEQTGITIVPDSVSTLRPGEMRFSDYQRNVYGSPAEETGVFRAVDQEVTTIAGDASGAVKDSSGRVIEGAVANNTGTTGEAGQALSAGARSLTGGVLDTFTSLAVGMIDLGHPIVNALAQQGAQYLLSAGAEAAMNQIFGAATDAAGVSAAVSVPVIDAALVAVNTKTDLTTSQLLGTSNEIKGMTEKILELQIQSCTHLKIMQRIQYAMEEKEFIGDRNAQKAASLAIKKAADEFLKDLSEGRTGSGGVEKQSFIVTNLSLRVEEEKIEVAGARVAQYSKLSEADAPFKAEVIGGDEEPTNLSLAPRWESRAEFDAFTQPRATTNPATPGTSTGASFWRRMLGQATGDPESVSSSAPIPNFWGKWSKVIQPQGNPLAAKVSFNAELAIDQAKAEDSFIEEYRAGRGIESKEICLEQVVGPNGVGYCPPEETKVVSPGSLLYEQASAFITSIIDQLEFANEAGSNFPAAEIPSQQNNNENIVRDVTGVPPAPSPLEENFNDICPGPEECPISI